MLLQKTGLCGAKLSWNKFKKNKISYIKKEVEMKSKKIDWVEIVMWVTLVIIIIVFILSFVKN